MKEKVVISAGITRAELANIYGVSIRIFNSWLSDLKLNHKKTLKPRELQMIIEDLYLPQDVVVNIKVPNLLIQEQKRLDF